MAGRYDLVVVDRQGHPKDTLDRAVFKAWTRTLNQPDQVEVSVPTQDPKTVAWLPSGPEVEYQLLRNGGLLTWGPLVRAQLQQDAPELTDVLVNDPLWYFHRRNFGKAGRTNLLANPTFAADTVGSAPASWTVVACTAAVTSDYGVPGYQSVRLSGAAAGADAYIGQQVAHTAGASEPDLGILTATFILEAFTAPAGPGQEQRGVYLGVLDHTGAQVGAPAYVPITNGTGQATLLTVQAAASMPAGEAGHFDVRLYDPEGTVVYRDLSLVLEESLSTPPAGEDQSTTIGRIVDYAQGRIAGLADGKSDLNIDHNCPAATGIIRVQAYQFSAHEEILQALAEYPAMADGVDYWMVYTRANGPTAGTRMFTTGGRATADGVTTVGSNTIQSATAAVTVADKYQPIYATRTVSGSQVPVFPSGTVITGVVDSTHFAVSSNALASATGVRLGIGGRKGSYKPDLALVLNRNVLPPASDALLDAEQAASDFIELGTEDSSATDDGAGRPEGGASDSSLMGGLTLMTVEQAPSNLTLDSLNSLASRRLKVVGGLPIIPTLRCYGEELIANLETGDVVPVDYDYGWVQLHGDYRVISIGLDIEAGDLLDVEVGLPVL